MKDITERLILMFAENSVEEVNKNCVAMIQKYFAVDFTEIIKEVDYLNNFEHIQNHKNELEERFKKLEKEGKLLNEKNRIISCLNYCLDIAILYESNPGKRGEEIGIISKLVKSGYGKKWNKEQMEHFENVSEMLRDYHTFFLSYTNRDAASINSSYENVWKKILEKEDQKDSEIEKPRNMLARAFFKEMRRRGLVNGFLDKKNIRISEDIDVVVKESVKKSFAFVQLISTGTMEYNHPNWCYEEFTSYPLSREKYKKDNDYKAGFRPINIYIFVQENPLPVKVPLSYNSWFSSTNKLHLDYHLYNEHEVFIGEIPSLVAQIYGFIDEMIQSVPE